MLALTGDIEVGYDGTTPMVAAGNKRTDLLEEIGILTFCGR